MNLGRVAVRKCGLAGVEWNGAGRVGVGLDETVRSF